MDGSALPLAPEAGMSPKLRVTPPEAVLSYRLLHARQGRGERVPWCSLVRGVLSSVYFPRPHLPFVSRLGSHKQALYYIRRCMQPHYPRQRVVLDTVSFTSNFGSLCFALVFFFFFFFFWLQARQLVHIVR